MNNQRNNEEGSETMEADTQQQFTIQRFYIKDLSFEAPSTPQIFKQDWQPDVHLELNSNSQLLEDKTYEVVLNLVVTVKSKDKVAFLVELKQAGIFSIDGLAEADLNHALGSFCPSILYPYAREVVTDAVTKGGFPQLILAPINFEALYLQQQNAAAANQA